MQHVKTQNRKKIITHTHRKQTTAINTILLHLFKYLAPFVSSPFVLLPIFKMAALCLNPGLVGTRPTGENSWKNQHVIAAISTFPATYKRAWKKSRVCSATFSVLQPRAKVFCLLWTWDLKCFFRPLSFMYTDWVMKKTQEVTATWKKEPKINVKVNFYEVNMYTHWMGTQMYKIKHISLIYLRRTQIKESRCWITTLDPGSTEFWCWI